MLEKVQGIPGVLMLVPMLFGAIIHTWFPQIVLIGDPTTAIFTSNGRTMRAVERCSGSRRSLSTGIVMSSLQEEAMSIRRNALLKNMELVGFDDLNGKPGFQMALHKTKDGRYYLYTLSFRHNGWNIVEVTDPSHPRNVKRVKGPWMRGGLCDGQGTPKIQTADGLMLTAHDGTLKELHRTEPGLPFWGGLMIWEIETDPENSTLLGKFACEGGAGVHCFSYGGRDYAYVTGNASGFNGFILRIVDISNPQNPKACGRFWMDEEYLNNKVGGGAARYGSAAALHAPLLHANLVKDDICYCAYANKGVVLLDVKDKTQPKLIGCLPLNPPFGGGAAGASVHTVMPLGNRPYLVVTSEGERPRYFCNEASEGLFKKNRIAANEPNRDGGDEWPGNMRTTTFGFCKNYS